MRGRAVLLGWRGRLFPSPLGGLGQCMKSHAAPRVMMRGTRAVGLRTIAVSRGRECFYLSWMKAPGMNAWVAGGQAYSW